MILYEMKKKIVKRTEYDVGISNQVLFLDKA